MGAVAQLPPRGASLLEVGRTAALHIPGFAGSCSQTGGERSERQDVERRIRDIPVTKEKNFYQSAC